MKKWNEIKDESLTEEQQKRVEEVKENMANDDNRGLRRLAKREAMVIDETDDKVDIKKKLLKLLDTIDEACGKVDWYYINLINSYIEIKLQQKMLEESRQDRKEVGKTFDFDGRIEQHKEGANNIRENIEQTDFQE